METRYSRDPQSFERMNSFEIREEFLIADLFRPDAVMMVYLHLERMIVGSAVPVSGPLYLAAGPELRAAYFAERREIGVFNIGQAGCVTVDGQGFQLACQEENYALGKQGRAMSKLGRAMKRTQLTNVKARSLLLMAIPGSKLRRWPVLLIDK